ncbi:hypothetical protein ACQKWADRAFT_281256 [Trichoderma austrokoningii]
MAHVERPSREQNLMHATRVGRSSPDGSPSFWLPIHTRRLDCPRPNRRRRVSNRSGRPRLRHEHVSFLFPTAVSHQVPGTCGYFLDVRRIAST